MAVSDAAAWWQGQKTVSGARNGRCDMRGVDIEPSSAADLSCTNHAAMLLASTMPQAQQAVSFTCCSEASNHDGTVTTSTTHNCLQDPSIRAACECNTQHPQSSVTRPQHQLESSWPCYTCMHARNDEMLAFLQVPHCKKGP